MPHIRITTDGFWVDGQRVEVYAQDFAVDFAATPPAVRCTIPADAMEIDLPEAVLSVLRDTSGEPSLREEVRSIRERVENLVHAFDPLGPPGRAVGRAINDGSRRGDRGGAK